MTIIPTKIGIEDGVTARNENHGAGVRIRDERVRGEDVTMKGILLPVDMRKNASHATRAMDCFMESRPPLVMTEI
jgi:hypothetical protein